VRDSGARALGRDVSLSLWHRGCVTGIHNGYREGIFKCACMRVHSIECIRYGHGRMRITDGCERAFNKSAVDVEEGAWTDVGVHSESF
jgi:hypothetical protein